MIPQNASIADLLLIVVLAVALVTDLKSRKIYDWTTIPAMALGLLIGFSRSIYHDDWNILIDCLIGLVVAFVVFLIIGLVGGMGGGDIKLMTALGAIEGGAFILYATVYIALAGGILALLHLIITGKFFHFFGYYLSPILKPLLPKLKPLEKPAHTWLPYGVAIVAGALYTLFIMWDIVKPVFLS